MSQEQQDIEKEFNGIVYASQERIYTWGRTEIYQWAPNIFVLVTDGQEETLEAIAWVQSNQYSKDVHVETLKESKLDSGRDLTTILCEEDMI